MYIFKNAFRCIARAKGRNILIGAVVLLLSVSSCIGLSIRQANKSLKKQYAESMEISGTLNPKNRQKNGGISLEALQSLAENSAVSDFNYTASLYFAAGDDIEPLDVAGSFKQNKDFREQHGNIRSGQSTSATESAATTVSKNTGTVILLSNTESSDSSQTGGGSSEDAEPQSKPSEPTTPENDSEKETTASEDSGENEPKKPAGKDDANQEKSDGKDDNLFGEPPQMPSTDGNGNSGTQSDERPQMPSGRSGGDTFITNNFFFNMASMNDFTVMSYSKTSAMPEYLSALDVIDDNSEALDCVISENLATENEFKVGSTFTLKNPDNEDEVYTFTVAGLCDTSKSSDDTQSTSSNASFTDNYIYISGKALDKILSDSAVKNPADETKESAESTDKDSDESKALTATYNGTFIFANLDAYNSFGDSLGNDYTLVSEDVSNYEQSISQLEALGKYATYFLIVIFVIGAFVLVIINLFSIRSRKYEIGVLTAIGMKKYKVATQFVIELFVVTFIAIIIGSAVGAATSVPVTNSLLTTVNEVKTSVDNAPATDRAPEGNFPGGGNPSRGNIREKMTAFGGNMNNYVAQISTATDLTVIIEMVGVGLALTLISSLAAVTFVMRYEPLKILNNRD